MRTKVLIVEDDKGISAFMSTMLEAKGMSATIAETGAEAKSLFASNVPDLVLLDLGLPDMDGAEVIRYIRDEVESNVPIIVVSARMEEKEKVEALDLGVDDYITKPFGTEELAARVRRCLKRSKSCGDANIYQAGDLCVDIPKWTVTIKGKSVVLTATEMKILITLIQNAGRVMSHKEISKNVWGPHAPETANLRVNIVNIRRKLESSATKPKYIQTEPGVGYMIVDNEYKKKTQD